MSRDESSRRLRPGWRSASSAPAEAQPGREAGAGTGAHPPDPPDPTIAPDDTLAAAARAAARRRLIARGITALRVVFAIAGLTLLALLVRDAGADALLSSLSRAAKWLPLVLLLEVARVSMDAIATYFALGRRARHVPIAILARTQLIAAAVSALAPAGRTAAEATKAALLAPWAGAPVATAAAATTQAATLLATGIISIPCAWAAYRLTGASLITIALAVHAAGLLLGGTALRALMRAPRVGGFVARRLRRIAPATAAFQDFAREAPMLAPRPTLMLLAARILQLVQYATLAHAAGVDLSPLRALLAEGLNLISLAAGALVPAQIGVSEGAFALSASALGTTQAAAMTIALLAHTVQIVLVPIGALTPLVWKARTPRKAIRDLK